MLGCSVALGLKVGKDVGKSEGDMVGGNEGK